MPNWEDPILDWDDGNIDHIWERHGVLPEEVEEAFLGRTAIRRDGDFYRVFGRSREGRYLFIVCIVRPCLVRVISARDMDAAERRYYERHS